MSKSYLLLLCCLIFLGCASPHYKFAPMTQGLLKTLMIETNHIDAGGNIRYNSILYAAPTTAWITNKFTPALKNFYFEYDLNQYALRQNDCVRFSTHALSVAYRLYYHDEGRLEERGLSVGIFDYATFSNFTLHEIIFFIVNDGDGFRVVFYEPQLQKIVRLNFFELMSCNYWEM